MSSAPVIRPVNFDLVQRTYIREIEKIMEYYQQRAFFINITNIGVLFDIDNSFNLK